MSAKNNVAVVAVVLVLTAVLAGVGFAARQLAITRQADPPGRPEVDPGIMVGVATVEIGESRLEIHPRGWLSAFTELTVAAQQPGIVEEQLVEVSDRVSKGDPLFQIDHALRATAIKKARAEAERAKSELELAAENLTRIERLNASESTNPTEVRQVRTKHAIARAVLKRAEASVEEAMLLEQQATIRSPLTGVVSRIYTRAGEYAHMGQPLADVMETDRLKLNVQLDDREVVAFNHGDAVTLRVPAMPGRRFAGRILRIYPGAQLDSRMFEIEIEIPNADGLLRPGFWAEATLLAKLPTTDENDPSAAPLVIPRMSVFERYGQTYCFAIRASDGALRAYLTQIETFPLLSDPHNVRVVHGLSVGDRVVTTGLQHVTHEAVVQLDE